MHRVALNPHGRVLRELIQWVLTRAERWILGCSQPAASQHRLLPLLLFPQDCGGCLGFHALLLLLQFLDLIHENRVIGRYQGVLPRLDRELHARLPSKAAAVLVVH